MKESEREAKKKQHVSGKWWNNVSIFARRPHARHHWLINYFMCRRRRRCRRWCWFASILLCYCTLSLTTAPGKAQWTCCRFVWIFNLPVLRACDAVFAQKINAMSSTDWRRRRWPPQFCCAKSCNRIDHMVSTTTATKLSDSFNNNACAQQMAGHNLRCSRTVTREIINFTFKWIYYFDLGRCAWERFDGRPARFIWILHLIPFLTHEAHFVFIYSMWVFGPLGGDALIRIQFHGLHTTVPRANQPSPVFSGVDWLPQNVMKYMVRPVILNAVEMTSMLEEDGPKNNTHSRVGGTEGGRGAM